jgi:uncharacterized membrane protein YecN with MAPEG domain
MDLQVKQVLVVVQAYSNATFYVSAMAVHMIAVTVWQAHRWHFHHAY